MQTRHLVGLAIAAILLTGCTTTPNGGSETAGAPPTQDVAVPAPETVTVTAPPETITVTPTSTEPGFTEENGDSGNSEPPVGIPTSSATDDVSVTSIEMVWPDESWSIEEIDEDLCATVGPYPSGFSEQEDVFSCGAGATQMDACVIETGETVVCINAHDQDSRRGLTFTSPTAADYEGGTPEQGARPLQATLENGVTCSAVGHDHHGPHWNDLSSWYPCDDGSELLSDEQFTDTFTVEGGLWTAQRSVDQGEPKKTAVASVVFAGR